MTGVGIGELLWLVLAALLGIGVVVVWIIKSEASRNYLKSEVLKLKSRLESAERDSFMMAEELGELTGSVKAGGSQIDASGDVLRENARLRRELDEAKNSLEEVYKALCSK